MPLMNISKMSDFSEVKLKKPNCQIMPPKESAFPMSDSIYEQGAMILIVIGSGRYESAKDGEVMRTIVKHSLQNYINHIYIDDVVKHRTRTTELELHKLHLHCCSSNCVWATDSQIIWRLSLDLWQTACRLNCGYPPITIAKFFAYTEWGCFRARKTPKSLVALRAGVWPRP